MARRPDPNARTTTGMHLFAAFADIGYSIWRPTRRSHVSKPSKKGKKIMGDKSPKSVHKQASQKQAKANAEAQKKKQAVAAKQVLGQK